MRFSAVSLFAVPAIMHAAALPTEPADSAPAFTVIDGKQFKLVPFTWTGTVIEGEPEETYTGKDIEDVIHQIEAAHPGWVLPGNATDPDSKLPELDHETGEALRKRDNLPICNTGHGGKAKSSGIFDGIDYLRRIGGRPGAEAGSCSRVSCSWNNAIHWCNGRSVHATEYANTIADYARVIVYGCQEAHNMGSDNFPNFQWVVNGGRWASDYTWLTLVNSEFC